MTMNMSDMHLPHPWLEERKKGDPRKHHGHKNFNDQLAVYITKKFGTMGMFYGLVVWMLAWSVFAYLGIGWFAHDPYPFTFLLFLSNLVQLWALPVLAVGQQVLSRAADRQASQTYRDAEEILKLQDEVHRLIKINNRITEDIHALLLEKTRG